MEDLFKELLAYYKEKTKLPIVSTYVILLIVWNWDIISIYLFSSVNMETRICWISNMVTWYNHFFRIFIPACLAFLYPIVTKKLTLWNNNLSEQTDYNLFTQTKNKRINNAKTEFEVEKEKTGKKELETLRVEKEALQNTIDDLTSKLDNANKLNEDLGGDIENLKKINDKVIEDINILSNQNSHLLVENEKLINQFEKHHDFVRRSNLETSKFIKLSNSDKGFTSSNLTEDETILNYLLDNGLIRRTFTDNGKEVFYIFTDKGKNFVRHIQTTPI